MSQRIQQPTTATASPTTVSECQRGAQRECPECGGTDIGHGTDATSYCERCGVVLSADPIERSEPGWTPQSERRTGPTSSVTRESVGTTFQPTAGENSAWILRRYNDRLEYSVRALKDGLREVRSLCSACDLPGQARQRAAWLYRRAAASDLLHGRSREGIAAACVYAAARDGEHPVTLSEVATVSPVEKQRISNDYRTVVQELGTELKPPQPEQFLAKVASSVGISFAVQRRAADLLHAARAEGYHVGQSPSGVAATAVYLAADRSSVSVTQQEVADAASVSAATVSRQLKTLRELSEPAETERHTDS